MIICLNNQKLTGLPSLREEMFSDRAALFHDRLNWDVRVDENGWEHDAYDETDPLYVIKILSDGSHGGSIRLLPTQGRTMINEYFLPVLGYPLKSNTVWECSRFCIPDRSPPNTSREMFAFLRNFMPAAGIKNYLGVFDAKMLRLYYRLGWSPKIIGESDEFGEKVYAGLWSADMKKELHKSVYHKAQASPRA